jgi:hypothetical protein
MRTAPHSEAQPIGLLARPRDELALAHGLVRELELDRRERRG